MKDRLRHFLLVFDHSAGRLVSHREFRDAKDALDAYSIAERSYTREQNVEVVLVGADSLSTVQRTHANYFEGAAKSVQKYLVGLGLD